MRVPGKEFRRLIKCGNHRLSTVVTETGQQQSEVGEAAKMDGIGLRSDCMEILYARTAKNTESNQDKAG